MCRHEGRTKKLKQGHFCELETLNAFFRKEGSKVVRFLQKKRYQKEGKRGQLFTSNVLNEMCRQVKDKKVLKNEGEKVIGSFLGKRLERKQNFSSF